MNRIAHAESHPQSATAAKKPAVAAKPKVSARTTPVPAKAATPKAKPVQAAPTTAPSAVKSAKLPKPPKAQKVSKAPKPEKPLKTGSALVRDSFTMPEDDFKRIATLKARALKVQRPAKKSELLRAGLQVLEGLSAAALVEVLNHLVTLKPGRPKKHR